IAQSFHQSAITIAAFTQLASLLVDAALQRKRQQLIIQLDLDSLGRIAAYEHHAAFEAIDAANGDQQIPRSAHRIANLPFDIRNLAPLFERVRVEQYARQKEVYASLLQDIGRRVAENQMRVWRDILQSASIIGYEDDVGNG